MKVQLMVSIQALDHWRKSLILISLKQLFDCKYLKKEIFNFKVGDKNFNFQTQFCQRSISNAFSATESKEVSLNGNKYDFLVD